MNPLDQARLALRIERLLAQPTATWDPADALELRNALPDGRSPPARRLPSPGRLRGTGGPPVGAEEYRCALALCGRLEGLIYRNRPERRLIRAIQRGRLPLWIM